MQKSQAMYGRYDFRYGIKQLFQRIALPPEDYFLR